MEGKDKQENTRFYKELPKMMLLVILYSFQGLGFGMFFSTVPIIFKKDLSYSEIGVLMLCTLPFSLKVLWSPAVEFNYSEKFGKRKSWIVPT
jgi:MFS transporter, PAT family, solute carrier family 33 (acetyl-CoA transportor), member 1